MWWSTSSGRIELNITKRQAESCSHSGRCDDDVMELSNIPAIRRQINKLDPALIASELSEYGAWDDEELKDHAQNIQRLLWVASNDIKDEIYDIRRH